MSWTGGDLEVTHTLVLGEALVDAVTGPEGTTVEHVGGSPANVAFGLAALEHQVDLATWIGTDERGERIADVCRSRRVTLTRGSQDAPATSVAHATVDARGAAQYTFELEWQLSPVPGPAAYAHLHTGSIAAVLEPGGTTVRQTLARERTHATVSYDPNARPSLMGSPEDARSVIEEVVSLSDVVKLSDEDLAWLYPDRDVSAVLRRLGSSGPALVVVTLGALGARALLTRSGEEVELPAAPTLVVDTVGAGDSFMAGLVSGLLDAGLLGGTSGRARLGRAGVDEIVPALERGLATAACTVARAGAHAPTRADLS
jgi:fructokinase